MIEKVAEDVDSFLLLLERDFINELQDVFNDLGSVCIAHLLKHWPTSLKTGKLKV